MRYTLDENGNGQRVPLGGCEAPAPDAEGGALGAPTPRKFCESTPMAIRLAVGATLLPIPGACKSGWWWAASRAAARQAITVNPVLFAYMASTGAGPGQLLKCDCDRWHTPAQCPTGYQEFPGWYQYGAGAGDRSKLCKVGESLVTDPTGKCYLCTATRQVQCARGYYPDTPALRESCGTRGIDPQPDSQGCYRCNLPPSGVSAEATFSKICPEGYRFDPRVAFCQIGQEVERTAYVGAAAGDQSCFRCVTPRTRPEPGAATAPTTQTSRGPMLGDDGRWYAPSPDGLGGYVVWNGAAWCKQ